MLVQLTARNVVLFERMAFELEPGFNVLTGETGAGKSMIIDAFDLVLGGRARPDIVRTGETEAEVEALFEVEPGSRVAAKLEAAGVPCGFEGGKGELVVRRVVQAGEKDAASAGGRGKGKGEARSRAFVNGRICTAAQLADLAADLCDVSSQHESVSLTDPATHMDYLDAFGKLSAARDALGTEVDALGEVAKELAEVARGRTRPGRARGLPRVPAARDHRARSEAGRRDRPRERARAPAPRGPARRSDAARSRPPVRRRGRHLRRARPHGERLGGARSSTVARAHRRTLDPPRARARRRRARPRALRGDRRVEPRAPR